ncbi:MAG TPA: phosphoribosylaminoimidazolesuccinocarboxamide synthase [Candidatus Mailhella merdavium]|nr:phosphoribosylaminoimidazolesuccinocarboxamide synthase [Candidatus Mailhella merdavium]
MNHPVVTQTNIGEFPLISRGKVRDIYDIDDETLLIVTTDRMSAFDVIMSSPIPMKGVVLNQLTLFWMKRFSSLVPNHIKEADVDRYPAALRPYRDELAGRSLLAKKAKPLPVECIVRGYLAGSGWKDYRKNGEVCGHKLPAGLEESSKLPEPIFTPSTKAAIGQHDENISLREAEKILGVEKAHAVADLTMNIYRQASEYAAGRGIIIADTKFEFGMVDGELTLIDEVLTPDSSRFWPAKGYAPGRSQPSFDKQYLRDWLEQQPWDKTPPPPALPEDVVKTTTEKYLEAYHIITGSHIQ